MVVGLVVRQEGAFFLTLAGLFRVGASTGVHECFSKRPCLKLSFSAPPGHSNAPRLTNMSKAAGHRVRYQS